MLWGLLLFGLAACQPFVVPPGQSSAVPHLADKAYVTDDGARLPLRTWGPLDRPKAVVLALHGFGDYSNAFEAAGRQLAKHGIRTLAYDQRGFGRSPEYGRWHGLDRLTQDAADAVRLLARRYGPVPVYVLGHSMGGAIAMVMAADHPDLPLAGLALVAPAVWGRQTMPAVQEAGLWLSAHAVPWFPVSGQGLNILPSDNLEMLRRLARDPLVMKRYRVDLVWGLANAMDAAVYAANKLRVTTLFLYGLKDELVPMVPTRRALLMVPAAGRRVALYRNGHHMLLRDLNGAEAVADLAAWFLDPLAPLPSGADRGGMRDLLAADPR